MVHFNLRLQVCLLGVSAIALGWSGSGVFSVDVKVRVSCGGQRVDPL
jgi:hypothetical protein